MNSIATFELRQKARVECDVLTGGVEVIERLAAEWRAMCDEGPSRAPFYQPEWIAAYVRAFKPRTEVVVVTARAAGRLLAVLPLVRTIVSYGGMRARALMSAGNVHTVRFDIAFGASAYDPVPELWQQVAAIGAWDVFQMQDVPRGRMGGRLARHAQSLGYAVSNVRSATTPYLALDARGGIEAVMNRLDPKFRSNLRRRRRKLAEHGPVRLVEALHPADGLARFYAMERNSWKGEQGSAITCDPSTRQFYDDAANALAERGMLSLYTLYAGNDAVAMYYGARTGDAYYLLKTAFDTRFRECSPGQLITQSVLEDLCARGCRTFHFLGWHADWKRDWHPHLATQANWYVFRGARGNAIHRTHFRFRRVLGRTLRLLKGDR